MGQPAFNLADVQEDVYEKNIMQDNDENETPLRKGRPRSEKSRKAILKATNALLLHSSVQDLSIEAIAKKAKVGKTTIYRWWPNKTSVVMDALMSQPGLNKPLPTPSNNAEAIKMQLDKLIYLLDSKNGQIIAQLFSEAQSDEQSQKIFNDNFLAPLIDAIEYSVSQGQEDGEFSKKLDPKMVVDMLCGPIFFRLMSHGQDFDDEFRNNFPNDIVRLISA
ncbi:MAG: TetR/AcrR family transcriptional regulator [Alphaproteobacteria bacterium]